ncbi:hypothetical protein FB451DRAFT_1170466 [Mycena latifolia]|nr:hypothetical protein FB451DRAFT_1170466 [Mycena latifolia]
MARTRAKGRVLGEIQYQLLKYQKKNLFALVYPRVIGVSLSVRLTSVQVSPAATRASPTPAPTISLGQACPRKHAARFAKRAAPDGSPRAPDAPLAPALPPSVSADRRTRCVQGHDKQPLEVKAERVKELCACPTVLDARLQMGIECTTNGARGADVAVEARCACHVSPQAEIRRWEAGRGRGSRGRGARGYASPPRNTAVHPPEAQPRPLLNARERRACGRGTRTAHGRKPRARSRTRCHTPRRDVSARAGARGGNAVAKGGRGACRPADCIDARATVPPQRLPSAGKGARGTWRPADAHRVRRISGEAYTGAPPAEPREVQRDTVPPRKVQARVPPRTESAVKAEIAHRRRASLAPRRAGIKWRMPLRRHAKCSLTSRENQQATRAAESEEKKHQEKDAPSPCNRSSDSGRRHATKTEFQARREGIKEMRKGGGRRGREIKKRGGEGARKRRGKAKGAGSREARAHTAYANANTERARERYRVRAEGEDMRVHDVSREVRRFWRWGRLRAGVEVRGRGRDGEGAEEGRTGFVLVPGREPREDYDGIRI